MPLLRASEQVAEAGAQASARRARQRAARALQLVLAALSDPERRPPEPRDLMPRELIHHRPRVEFDLTSEGLCKNLRTSRRGVAAGHQE